MGMGMSEVTVAEHGAQIREHERRLNTYNGSLERMADSVDSLIVEQAEWKATVRAWAAILSVLFGIVSPVLTSLTVYLITR